MPTHAPSSHHLATLLRLLDDSTPEVRASVAQELEAYQGDVSDWIGTIKTDLPQSDQRTLARLLRPARRARLESDWIVPSRGIVSLVEDWEAAEALLRAESDFLHDGISIRQPLGDALDLLAEEAEAAFADENEAGMCRILLRDFLKADTSGDLFPELYDLAALADGAPGNSVGLAAVIMLVGHRLGASVRGVNFPGTFYLVIPDPEIGHLTFDPAAGLRPIEPQVLTQRVLRASPALRAKLQQPFTPGDLVLRITEEIETAFAVGEDAEDAELFGRLSESLRHQG